MSEQIWRVSDACLKISLIGLVTALGGCTPGFIYTDQVVPLTLNMDRTPRAIRMASSSTKSVKVPLLSSADISAGWSSSAIGDAAKRGGLERIYYADHETFSILGGVWRQETVQVWGE